MYQCRAKIRVCVFRGNQYRARRDLGEGLHGPWTGEPWLPSVHALVGWPLCPLGTPLCFPTPPDFHAAQPCLGSAYLLPSASPNLHLGLCLPWPLLPGSVALKFPRVSFLCCSFGEYPVVFVLYVYVSWVPLFFNNMSLPYWQWLYFIKLFGFSYWQRETEGKCHSLPPQLVVR